MKLLKIEISAVKILLISSLLILKRGSGLIASFTFYDIQMNTAPFAPKSFNLLLKKKIVLFSSQKDESSSSSGNSSRMKKRLKRKKDSNLLSSESFSTSAVEEESSSSDFVDIQVKDINEVVRSSTLSEAVNALEMSQESLDNSSFSSSDDKLQSLLADAKRLRKDKGDSPEENESTQVIQNVLSTIVTLDFFLVLGFLAWFLVGVISSNLFGNDAIQLAFNGIFQPIVQPALGILMISSIASGTFGEKKE